LLRRPLAFLEIIFEQLPLDTKHSPFGQPEGQHVTMEMFVGRARYAASPRKSRLHCRIRGHDHCIAANPDSGLWKITV
jgi:hypothetical protein